MLLKIVQDTAVNSSQRDVCLIVAGRIFERCSALTDNFNVFVKNVHAISARNFLQLVYHSNVRMFTQGGVKLRPVTGRMLRKVVFGPRGAVWFDLIGVRGKSERRDADEQQLQKQSQFLRRRGSVLDSTSLMSTGKKLLQRPASLEITR
jgi:hypothetical protein